MLGAGARILHGSVDLILQLSSYAISEHSMLSTGKCSSSVADVTNIQATISEAPYSQVKLDYMTQIAPLFRDSCNLEIRPQASLQSSFLYFGILEHGYSPERVCGGGVKTSTQSESYTIGDKIIDLTILGKITNLLLQIPSTTPPPEIYTL